MGEQADVGMKQEKSKSYKNTTGFSHENVKKTTLDFIWKDDFSFHMKKEQRKKGGEKDDLVSTCKTSDNKFQIKRNFWILKRKTETREEWFVC